MGFHERVLNFRELKKNEFPKKKRFKIDAPKKHLRWITDYFLLAVPVISKSCRRQTYITTDLKLDTIIVNILQNLSLSTVVTI